MKAVFWGVNPFELVVRMFIDNDSNVRLRHCTNFLNVIHLHSDAAMAVVGSRRQARPTDSVWSQAALTSTPPALERAPAALARVGRVEERHRPAPRDLRFRAKSATRATLRPCQPWHWRQP